MITTDKVTEIFCVLDDFCKNLDTELTKNLHIAPWTRDISEWETAKGKCPKAKSWPSYCATILAHSATSSTITSFSSRNIWQATSSMPFPTRVSWNSCSAYFSTWCPSCASKVLESAWALVSSTVQWFQYATTWEGNSTRCLMNLPRTERERWAGALVSSCICCATRWATYLCSA